MKMPQLPRFSLIAGALLTLSLSALVVGQSTCRTTAPTAPQPTTLSTVKTANITVPNDPFQIVYAKQQREIAFVTLAHVLANSTLGVLNTSAFVPTLIHQIPLPRNYIDYEGASGLTLTEDGQYLFVSAGEGAVILNASLAAVGSPNAIVGTLNGTTVTQYPGNASIQITLTADSMYAFVSQEYGQNQPYTTGNVNVFRLQTSQNGSVGGFPLGYLSLGYEIVGTALSPDGRTLYATSEAADAKQTTPGFISVIAVDALINNPFNPHAVLSNVTASCGPVRTILSPDGEIVWVTARESDALLAFNASLMLTDPENSLITSTTVGTAPVGLIMVANGTRILTADSNRFDATNATSGLSVVDVQAALAGSPNATLGKVLTGLFPREFALSPDEGTVLVADYMSKQIQAIDVASLP